MDGLDVIRELRLWESRHRFGFRQYVIGISAHASKNDAQHGIVLGMNAYRNKPLTLQDLNEIAHSDDVVAISKMLDGMELRRKTAVKQASFTIRKECLIATDDSTGDDVTRTVQELGWLPVRAPTKVDFLAKLRSRNWDAILFDGDLPDFSTSLTEFREWESCNRVHRQHNLFVLSSGCPDATTSILSLVELPSGIDGVLGKPLSPLEVKNMLSVASRGKDSVSFSTRDIITR